MASGGEIDSFPKLRKPADSAFKQQRLPAWQPILTAGTVLPTFFIIGIAFIPVGVGLLYFSNNIQEKIIDYTHCRNDQNKTCAEVIAADLRADCSCNVPFELEEDYNGNVFVYYGLTNFYQNHRKYVKSRDDYQLLGQSTDVELSEDCGIFKKAKSETGEPLPVAPCGAVANSMFSDELTLYSNVVHGRVPLLRTGIAWPSDKEKKFKNPELKQGQSLRDAFKGTTRPERWKKYVYELDMENESNNGYQNEDLIVWMRTAALPTFRKLYRRVDHAEPNFQGGLKKGPYVLEVKYNFSVVEFEGTKKMILSTTSLLGGKNPFLGYAYIVVGSICLLLAVFLLIIHIKFSKSNSEIININPTTTTYQ